MNATLLENVSKPAKEQFPRLAFSLNETAEMLGLSYITVYRLDQRRKLKSSGAIRHKLIAKAEIERFLAA
jgi:hypothetical protein